MFRSSNHKNVDAALLEWFKQGRTQGVPISGPPLTMKAEWFAKELGDTLFMATTGFSWLVSTTRSLLFMQLALAATLPTQTRR